MKTIASLLLIVKPSVGSGAHTVVLTVTAVVGLLQVGGFVPVDATPKA